MSEAPIRIKRYPNRRFYASHTRQYISLPEIEALIRKGGNVEIIDYETGEDITRSVLIQIIAERHPDKMAIFPPAMLHSILRANSAVAEIWQEFFRRTLAAFESFPSPRPDAAQQPMNWLQAWFDTWSANANRAPKRRAARSQAAAPDLGKRIEELEKRIAELESHRKRRG